MDEKKAKSRRQIKKEIITLLENRWPQGKEELLSYPLKALLNPLFIALCHPAAHVRQNAVEGFAVVVPRLAEQRPEEARIVMRRFLWSLNDESGGIGWGAPEAMAAIMCNSDMLRKEYVHMLISYMRDDGPELFQDGNFLELPMLQLGLLWGIDLLCQHFPELMRKNEIEPDLLFYLDSENKEVAGAALLALYHLGCDVDEERLQSFLDRQEVVSCCEGGKREELIVSDVAKRMFLSAKYRQPM